MAPTLGPFDIIYKLKKNRNMTKKLDVLGRIMALTVLPKETNLVLWKIINGLKTKLSFTEEEIKEYELVFEGTSTKWNRVLDKGKDIEFTEAEENLIKEGLNNLDKEKRITEQHIPLCIAFGLME